jgi:hypothetical protein
MTNRCAAYGLTIPERDSGNSNDLEVELRTQLSKQSKIAAPVFSKRPFMSHADFTQLF